MADERVERIAEFIKPLRVKPGSKLNLGKDFDHVMSGGIFNRDDYQKAFSEMLSATSTDWAPSSASWRPRRPRVPPPTRTPPPMPQSRKAPATRPATRTGAADREQRTRPPR